MLSSKKDTNNFQFEYKVIIQFNANDLLALKKKDIFLSLLKKIRYFFTNNYALNHQVLNSILQTHSIYISMISEVKTTHKLDFLANKNMPISSSLAHTHIHRQNLNNFC